MVFHMRDKHHRTLGHGNFDEMPQPLGSLESEDALKLVHHPGHSRTGGNNQIVRTGVYMSFQNALGFVIGEGHGPACFAAFRMGVADIWTKTLKHQAFDGMIKPPTRSPVGVDDTLLAIG